MGFTFAFAIRKSNFASSYSHIRHRRCQRCSHRRRFWPNTMPTAVRYNKRRITPAPFTYPQTLPHSLRLCAFFFYYVLLLSLWHSTNSHSYWSVELDWIGFGFFCVSVKLFWPVSFVVCRLFSFDFSFDFIQTVCCRYCCCRCCIPRFFGALLALAK